MKDLYRKTVECIREIYNKPDGIVPLHAPVFIGNEKKYLEDCIDSTFVSSIGVFVERFEEKIADYTGSVKAVACVNGTNALYLALKLVGVSIDSEVITQALTFVATTNSISYCGAYPIFLDVDFDTMGLSPKALSEFLHSHSYIDPKTNKCINKTTKKVISACLPVHTFGNPCRIDEIIEICNSYHITVIEDAAESLGSFYKRQHTGTFGLIGVLSFNGNKIVTTGGGGMLLFRDENLAKLAKHLTTQAKLEHPWEFFHDNIGFNYRMPNINAALGLAQFEQLQNFLRSKRETADMYADFFSNTDIIFCREPKNSQSNYWLNCVLLNNISERDNFLKFTNQHGIQTRPVWTLMNKLPMYQDCQKDKLINTTVISKRLVNIPSSYRDK